MKPAYYRCAVIGLLVVVIVVLFVGYGFSEGGAALGVAVGAYGLGVIDGGDSALRRLAKALPVESLASAWSAPRRPRS